MKSLIICIILIGSICVELKGQSIPPMDTLYLSELNDSVYWRGVFITSYINERPYLLNDADLLYYRIYSKSNNLICDEVLIPPELPCDSVYWEVSDRVQDLFMLKKSAIPIEIQEKGIYKATIFFSVLLVPK